MEKIHELDFYQKDLLEKLIFLHEKIPRELLGSNYDRRSEVKIREFISSNKSKLQGFYTLVDNLIVGIIWGIKKKNEFHIMGLYIDIGFRRRGLAFRLKSEIEKIVCENDMLTTKVLESNVPMLILNKKLGYKVDNIKNGICYLSKTN